MKTNQDDFDKLFGEVKTIQDDTGVYRPLIERWLLEIAIMFEWYKPAPSHRRGKYPRILDDDDFCNLSGLAPNDDDDEEQPKKQRTAAQWKSIFNTRLNKVRKTKIDTGLPLFRNIALLSDMLKLKPADKFLFTFSAVMSLFPLFRGSISSCNLGTSHQTLHRILSRLSGLNVEDFQAATSEGSVLVSAGLVKISNGVKDLENKVELFTGIGNAMLVPHNTIEELSRRFLKRAASPTLNLDNFPHLVADSAVLIPYLQNAISSRTAGVNILLYGKPGVGKSEYVQVLASNLGIDLYEIAFADSDGDPIKGTGRLQAFAFCQNLLSNSENALLVFDEIEDVFPREETVGKAWINRTMELNPVPAIWVSNRISQIDPAFLRRFDYSVKFQTPPAAVRLSIARHHLGCFNPPQNWLERIAAVEDLTPSQLERAAKVARLSGGIATEDNLKLVDLVLQRSCSLLNTKNLPGRVPSKTGYNLNYLNTDVDIPALVDGLNRKPSASLCFYGPAGTGKSELARHIADEIGKPCIIRRASDILDKYVGESEKNIAEMFSEARQQGAVLVLDEADSFLSDRRDARRSWEVTQVNELLTQIESFDGIFICTTNLMDRLDQASLRRFAFKVKFDYLTPNQRWEMFLQELERLGGDKSVAEEFEATLRRLERLTPGDFAVAARQFELWGTAATAQKLSELLAKECEAKGGLFRKIGFGA
ncbi:MAG: ATP-binding protein [Desulfuromonadales bacterium]